MSSRLSYEALFLRTQDCLSTPPHSSVELPPLALPAVESNGLHADIVRHLPHCVSLRILPRGTTLHSTQSLEDDCISIECSEHPLSVYRSGKVVYEYELKEDLLLYNFDPLHYASSYDFRYLLPFIQADSDARSPHLSKAFLEKAVRDRWECAAEAMESAVTKAADHADGICWRSLRERLGKHVDAPIVVEAILGVDNSLHAALLFTNSMEGARHVQIGRPKRFLKEVNFRIWNGPLLNDLSTLVATIDSSRVPSPKSDANAL